MAELKLPSKLASFEDVTRAFRDLEKNVNTLHKAKSVAESETKETEGESGDIRVTRNVDGTYTFEVRTEEGWKTPALGNSVIKFKDKPSTISQNIVKSIDDLQTDDTTTGASEAVKSIFDEKENQFSVKHLTGISRPDYDSQWINYDFSAHEIGGSLPAWRHTHTLGQLPLLIKIYFAPNQESGTMGSGDTLTDPQSNVTWFTEINNHLGHSYANEDYYGLVSKVDMNYVYLVGGNARSGIYSNFSMSNANALETYDGAIRILMWK